MKLIANLHDIDQKAASQFGIAPETLMEAAGTRVAEAVLQQTHPVQNTVIVCGPGNNGGDGFVCARLLHRAGFAKLTVIYTGNQYKNETLANFEQLMTLPVQMVNAREQLALAQSRIENAAVIVDALFGSGLSRPVEGVEADLIATINGGHIDGEPQAVIAVDIPSGIDSATGQVMGDAVNADHTVTFATGKPGLYLQPGKQHAGKVTIADIGLPQVLIDADESPAQVITDELARDWLPIRDPQGHKYSFGSVVVIAGSRKMPGAAVLTSDAALKSGAGMVTLAAPCSLFTHIPVPPELLREPLPESEDGFLTLESLPTLLETIRNGKTNTVVMGPGLGREPETVQCLRHLLEALNDHPDISVVIDADALYALSVVKDPAYEPQIKRSDIRFGPNVILTPHLGEAARLLQSDSESLSADLLQAAKTLRETWQATVVLKSASTVVATADGALYVTPTGSSGLAKGGSGDVLAGILAGLMAQEATPEIIAPLGVYLHGLAAGAAAVIFSEYGMRASNITECLTHGFRHLLEANKAASPDPHATMFTKAM